MAGDISIRQRIISDVVQTVQGSGLVRGVEDAEPWNYLTVPLPYAWVIEGGEFVTLENLDSRADCRLTVLVQMAFGFRSNDAQRTLYRVGRRLLADVQELMMVDYTRGGYAFFTREVSNAIAAVEASEKPVGILTTEWEINYHRQNRDPYSN